MPLGTLGALAQRFEVLAPRTPPAQEVRSQLALLYLPIGEQQRAAGLRAPPEEQENLDTFHSFAAKPQTPVP